MCPKVTTTYTDQKVQSILNAARTAFIQNGFAQTTMKHIVEAADISRGGLYLYFSSTEEIFEALMESDSQADAESMTLIENGRSTKEVLSIFLDGEKAAIKDIRNTLIPAAYEFFMMRMRNGTSNAFLTERNTRAVQLLERVIRNGIVRAEFRPGVSAEKMAYFIVAFLEGLIATAISVGVEEETLNEQMELLQTLLNA